MAVRPGWLAALLWLGLVSGPGGALAFRADTPLADPKLEARAHAIAHSIRCLVCQNESIEDSNAPLAEDLRVIVRERLAAGDSDDAVRQFLVARYGDWVLLKPPFNAKTYLLWLGPALLLLAAGGGVAVYYRHQSARGAAAVPTPLNADEQRRLQALLDDSGPA